MDEIEKIIKGINAIQAEFPCDSSYEIKEELNYYCDNAIKALEKQIGKKVVNTYLVNQTRYGSCPVCGYSAKQKGNKYCFDCGQKLDWNKN